MANKPLNTENPVVEEIVTSSIDERILLSSDQRLQFEEQIRMFIQLLTQFYLLSCRNLKELNFINRSSKRILMDLKRRASEYHILNVFNLDHAVAIVNEFEKMKEISRIPKKMNCVVGKTIMNNKVFIYPELLPKCGFDTRKPHKKVTFTKAEDNLIALGLEKFSGESAPIEQIKIHLLPSKKVSQIKFRIKNLKAARAPTDNPIKHYYAYKEAPPMPRNVKILDPNNIKVPKDHDFKELPEWMIPLVSKSKTNIIRQIAPNSVNEFCKPPFILPKSIIIGNGIMFQSVVPKNLDKNRQKRWVNILPKGKCLLKNDKELHSDRVNLSNLESNANNSSKSGSKQEYVLKNNITKSCDASDNKSDECNNAEDARKAHNNNSEVFMKNEIQDKPITEHLISLDSKYNEINIHRDVKNDKIQNRVKFTVAKGIKKNYAKHINKPSSALHRIKDNKSIENMKSKDKSLKILGKVIDKSLFVADDEDNKNNKTYSNSSVNLNDIKCHYQRTNEQLSNENNDISLKRQKFSATVDYFPDSTNKECGVIIKSEIIEEDESVEEVPFKNCTTPIISDFSPYSVNRSNLVQTNHRKLKQFQINEFKKSKHFDDSERRKSRIRKNSSFKIQNLNFFETENKNRQNSTAVTVAPKIINTLCVPIKQEVTDDFETAQVCESANDMDINKSIAFIKPEINHKKDITDIKSTLNSNNLIKTVDYLQCSNGEECGIVIKSEITEETTESLENSHKFDFNLDMASHIDFNSPAKDYITSFQKRKLRSANQCSFTKKGKTLQDNSYAETDLSESIQKSHNFSTMQNIKIGDEIVKTDFCGNNISIKSEIIQDNQTFLHDTNNETFKKPILKLTKNIIKSNSLEKAHLKESSKVKQIRKKNYQTKRKLRKRN